MTTLPRRVAQLERKLDALADTCEPMGISELDGYIAGIVICPDLILPNEWLVPIWGSTEGEPVFANDKEAHLIIRLVMEHYNETISALGKRSFEPIFLVDLRNNDILWELWIEGFQRAMAMRQESWLTYMNDDQEIAGALAGLVTLCGMADGDCPLSQHEIETLRAEGPNLIPEWVQILHDARIADQPFMTTPSIPMQNFKVGRNDPCSCGSGRKYKKCCGAN